MASNVSFSRDLAPQVLRNGYRIVWLRPHSKAPLEVGWTEKEVALKECAYVNEKFGVGIALGVGFKPVYAFDADVCGNVKLSRRFRRELIRLFPELRKSFCRIGQAPKFMIPFRMVTPGIGRSASAEFKLNDQKVQLEILGAGRQAAMLAIHDKTGLPYSFEPVDEDDIDPFNEPPSVLTVPVDSLPVLPDDAPVKAIELFERLAFEEGAVAAGGSVKLVSDDDRFYLMPAFPPLGVSAEVVEQWVKQAEWDVNSRESWFSLLCQLHHEFQGREDEGLLLADKLSSMATNGSYKGFDDVKRTWDSIHHSNEAGALTIRTLRRAAMQAAHKELFARATDPSLEGIAAKLVLDCEDALRFVSDESKSRSESGTWYFFNGLYWNREDEGPAIPEFEGQTGKVNIIAFAKSKIYPYLHSQAKQWDACHPKLRAFDDNGNRLEDDKGIPIPERNPWRKLYNKLANTPDAVKRLMTSFVAGYDFLRMSVADFDKVTPGSATFPAANGVIDLRTGAPVQPNPELYYRRRSSVVFDSNAKCPLWEKVVRQWLSGEEDRIEWLQNLFGYLLIGDPKAHILTILDGEGRNGKSVLLYILAQLFGQLHQVASRGTLVTRSGARGAAPSGAREDLMKLIGCRVATCSEFEAGARLRVEDVKAMTGQDIITARANYGKFVDFLPIFSIVIATNNVPTITERNTAVIERLRILKFKETFIVENGNKDDGLKDKLVKELSGILNWSIVGARRVLDLTPSVALTPTPNMLRDFRDFDEENDHFGNWAAACLIKSDGEGEASPRNELRDLRVLWNSWKDYASERGVQDMFSCQADLTRAMRKRKEFGFEFKAVKGRKYLRNYRLRLDEDETAEPVVDAFEALA